MLDVGVDGLDPNAYEFPDLVEAIRTPSPRRVFAIAQGLAHGWFPEEVASLTVIAHAWRLAHAEPGRALREA